MTAVIIYADFKSRTYHKSELPVVPPEIAQTIYESSLGFVDTAPSELIPFGGEGIDGMNLAADDPA
jgi:hypothetical protein